MDYFPTRHKSLYNHHNSHPARQKDTHKNCLHKNKYTLQDNHNLLDHMDYWHHNCREYHKLHNRLHNFRNFHPAQDRNTHRHNEVHRNSRNRLHNFRSFHLNQSHKHHYRSHNRIPHSPLGNSHRSRQVLRTLHWFHNKKIRQKT